MAILPKHPFTNWKPSTRGSSKLKLTLATFLTLKSRTTRGITMLELIVASVVALSILSVALGAISEQRRQVLGDRTQAGVNDNLRIASDIIGQDIKQTGELLDADFNLPGVSIIPGTNTGDPSTLVLQRQLLGQKLPVCQTLTAGSASTSIDVSVVSDTGFTPASYTNCPYSYTAPAAPATSEPSTTLSTLLPTDNLRQWRNYRCTADGPGSANIDACVRTTYIPSANCKQFGGTDAECSWAFIYDPVNMRGEFFLYSFEDRATCSHSGLTSRTCQRIRRADGNAWQNTYTFNLSGSASQQPQLYILEEKRYSLTADTNTTRTDDFVLQLSVNRQSPMRIANQLRNFQVRGKLPNDSTRRPSESICTTETTTTGSCLVSSFNIAAGQPAVNSQIAATPLLPNWQYLQNIQITLSSINPNPQLLPSANNNPNVLSLTSQFLPRNTASRSQ
jgi:hypothetical protein